MKFFVSSLVLFVSLASTRVAFCESCKKSAKFELIVKNEQGLSRKQYSLGESVQIPSSDLSCKVRGSWQLATDEMIEGVLPRSIFPNGDQLIFSCRPKTGSVVAFHASLASAEKEVTTLGAVIDVKNTHYLSIRCIADNKRPVESGRTNGSN